MPEPALRKIAEMREKMFQESALLMIPILLPVCLGLILLLGPNWESREQLCIFTGGCLVLTAISVVTVILVLNTETAFTLFSLTKSLTIYFKLDKVGRLFASIVTVVWLCAGLFSFTYMKHEKKEQRYYGFYLIVYGILIAIDFAGNLISFYLFYEMMTLVSLPLVLHSQSKVSILAGLKYLFYSMGGAYMALFGLYFLYRYTNTLTFTAGGVLDRDLIQGREPLLLVVGFLMLLGFGVKAGLFPLHGWLTSAHPVAPAPASAALSGIIVKAGVLGAIRVVYYVFGPDFLRGTWVQTVWLVLILITILMGSMMAYREKVWKKRLAYSTVSQVSYILMGLAMMQPYALEGALLHTVFHAFIKCGLFLTAGAMIYHTGKTRVGEYAGIGKHMPVVMYCYIGLSLALIGIPPASGFVSKWYLAIGCLESTRSVLGVLGPVILLLSALLTAGYLLPVAIEAFLPGESWIKEHGSKECGFKEDFQEKVSWQMCIPIIVLTILAIGLGIFTGPLGRYVRQIAQALIK